MKRLVLLGLTLLGCQSATGTSPSSFTGPNDLVFIDALSNGRLAEEGTESVNRFLVVTATNTNELRLLDLKSPTATQVVREPVRGPNPLETLSIPVLDRPTALSIDTRYEDGVRRKGALLYATRQGGPELSIVGVEPSELRELRRLPLPAPVTALTNLMVDAATSRVLVATFDGDVATVHELRLPADARTLRSRTTASLAAALTTKLQVRGESIVAMLAVPGLPGRTLGGRPFCAQPTDACLAIATRRLAGADGTSSLIDLATLEAAPLAFPGPVRKLQTNDRPLASVGGSAPAPGSILYGVLDEEACGSFRCGGVAAVDVRQGGPDGFGALEADGLATRPVRWNDGLVRGLTVTTGGELPNLGADGGVDAKTLLGVVTMSNGEILFFDGLTLSLIEQDATPATLGTARFNGDPWLEGPSISEGTPASAVLRATVKDGALRTQLLTISWQGELGAAALEAGARSFSSRELAARVLTGDRLTFAGEGCASATVTAISGSLVQFSPAPGCPATRVSVKAGPAAPFVIAGSVEGFLGRAAPGATFTLRGTPFIRIPGVPLSDPNLVIPFGRGTDTVTPAEGASWTVEVLGNNAPLVSIIDPALFTVQAQGAVCPQQLQLPGSAAFDPVRGRVFLAYPSSNLVAEFDARRAVRGPIGPNQGVTCHR